MSIRVGETVPWKVVVEDSEGNPFSIESATIALTDPSAAVTTPAATISGHQVLFSFSPNAAGTWTAKFTINISGGYTKIFTSTKVVVA